MKNKKFKTNFWSVKKYFAIGFILFLFLAIFFLDSKTGFFSHKKIDERDSAYWTRDKNGIVVGADEIIINGSKENCWLMIHGYSSGPGDLKSLGEKISQNFSDYIYIPRLIGHGEVPSHLLNLTLEDWYLQIEKIFDSLEKECLSVNVVGFSFGGALATKLAENKKVKNIYLISPYFFPKQNLFKIFDYSFYINLFADKVIYTKKLKIAQINSEEFLEEYFSYWNFVLLPVKNSEEFLEKTLDDSKKINESILIQHSKKDDTADILGSKILFGKISSENKELVLFEKSNHVLLFDYEKEGVIKNIINFENKNKG